MLLPQNGVFIDGTPQGGTVVNAAFLNAVLGEIVGVLELGDLEPQASGNGPDDHRQMQQVLSQRFIQVGLTEPALGEDGAIYLNVSELLLGRWPFYVSESGVWQPTPIPFFAETVPEQPGTEVVFDDDAHGFRGGGDLHAIATEFNAGFLAPEGVRALNRATAALGHRLSLQAAQLINYSLNFFGSGVAATLAATRANYGVNLFNLAIDHTTKISVSHSQCQAFFTYFTAGELIAPDFTGFGGNAVAQTAVIRAVMDLGNLASAFDLTEYCQQVLGVAVTVNENPLLNKLRGLS